MTTSAKQKALPFWVKARIRHRRLESGKFWHAQAGLLRHLPHRRGGA